MVAAFEVGMAMYDANMASNALQGAELHKPDMAATELAVTPAQLTAFANFEGPRGNISDGALLDTVNTVTATPNTTLIVGTKQHASTIPFVGTLPFTFTVSTAVQRQLLNAAAQGGTPRSMGGWFPSSFTGMLKPTQLFPLLPEVAEFNFAPGQFCQVAPVTSAAADVIVPQGGAGSGRVYVSQETDFGGSSPLKSQAIGELAVAFQGACQAEVNASVCSAEAGNLSTMDGGTVVAGNTVQQLTHNPPGSPGKTLTVTMGCTDPTLVVGDPTCVPVEISRVYSVYGPAAPPAGTYYDPSGAYTGPPGQFVPQCHERKVAECQVRKAVQYAQTAVANYASAHCR